MLPLRCLTPWLSYLLRYIGNDHNYATSITTALNAKAPTESPVLTGTATAANLTVSGALLIGTTNVSTALGEKATTAQLNLKNKFNND